MCEFGQSTTTSGFHEGSETPLSARGTKDDPEETTVPFLSGTIKRDVSVYMVGLHPSSHPLSLTFGFLLLRGENRRSIYYELYQNSTEVGLE